MINKATIDGNHNIVIQDTNKSQITIHTSDPDEIVEKVKLLNQEQLEALKKLLEEQRLLHYIEQVLRKLISNTPFPKELTALIRIPRNDIIGREKDLKELHRRLLEDKKPSLINGMGGIGKTTLAAVYVAEYYDAYDHIAWLTIESSLEEAILANHDLLTNLKLQDIPPKDLLSACLNKLRTMSSIQPGLLVLDNATQRLGKLYDALPKAPNWHVLVTSREIIEPFSVMELGFLTEKEAGLLFQKYNDKFTEEEIKSFVKEVEFHTLTIEILAKSARKNRWEADTVRNAIIENAKASISTSHSGYNKIDHVKAYLIQIFKVSNVDEKQEYLLKHFTALPNQWISYEQLYKLLQAEKLAWKDEFSETLEELYEKGYIQKDEPANSYKMHPVLVEALSPQLETTLEDLKLLIDSVTDLLSIDQTKDNPIDKFPFIQFGDTILQRLPNDTSTNIARLQNNLALVYRDLSEYEKARQLLEKALVSDIANYGEQHPNVSIRQSNLGLVYQDLGEYEKARDLLEKVLESVITNHGEQHPFMAKSQSNLGLVYRDLGEYEKARDLLGKALVLAITNYEEQHPIVAKNQSNLGLVYQDMGDYKKARELMEKALSSAITNYGEQHPTVERRQFNLALVYRDLSKYEKARELMEKALSSVIANYGEQHSIVANRQYNLAMIYAILRKYEKARELGKSAYDILFHSSGEHHLHTKMVKSFLDQIEGK